MEPSKPSKASFSCSNPPRSRDSTTEPTIPATHHEVVKSSHLPTSQDDNTTSSVATNRIQGTGVVAPARFITGIPNALLGELSSSSYSLSGLKLRPPGPIPARNHGAQRIVHMLRSGTCGLLREASSFTSGRSVFTDSTTEPATHKEVGTFAHPPTTNQLNFTSLVMAANQAQSTGTLASTMFSRGTYGLLGEAGASSSLSRRSIFTDGITRNVRSKHNEVDRSARPPTSQLNSSSSSMAASQAQCIGILAPPNFSSGSSCGLLGEASSARPIISHQAHGSLDPRPSDSLSTMLFNQGQSTAVMALNLEPNSIPQTVATTSNLLLESTLNYPANPGGRASVPPVTSSFLREFQILRTLYQRYPLIEPICHLDRSQLWDNMIASDQSYSIVPAQRDPPGSFPPEAYSDFLCVFDARQHCMFCHRNLYATEIRTLDCGHQCHSLCYINYREGDERTKLICYFCVRGSPAYCVIQARLMQDGE